MGNIRVRRGVESSRTLVTPGVGEPLFTTDTHKLYIGDGQTPGGIEIEARPVSGNTVTSVAGKTGVVVLNKNDVQLDRVNNTNDLEKPVSTATQAALDGKLNIGSLAPVATTGSYTSLSNKPFIPSSKADIGLSLADNTSDMDKPVSSAQQTAINAKQNTLVSGTNIKTINGTSLLGAGDITIQGGGGGTSGVSSVNTRTGAVTLTKADVNLANAEDTADLDKPVSTATQTALNGKANASHTHTKSQITDFAHTHTKSQITDFAHTHTKADITDFAHTHDAADITSGTIAPARLGTGTADATTVLYGDGTFKTAPSGGGGGMTNPMTAAGDLIVGGTSGAPTRLASSTTSNRVLTVGTAGSTPTYAQVNLTSMVTGALSIANGGTGRTSGTTAYGLIAAGTSANGSQQTISPGTAGQFLKSAGASALAAFAAITTADVSGLDSALSAKTNDSKITANGMGVCVHGTTAGTARPTGFAQIMWIGTVQPTNAVTNDIWYNG